MSLEHLNDLDREAKDEMYKSRCCERAKDLLADLRKGERSLSDALVKVVERWGYGQDEVAKNELHAVLNEMAADIYRIAEMRLAAKARFHKTQAAQKRAIVTASILPLPEENPNER